MKSLLIALILTLVAGSAIAADATQIKGEVNTNSVVGAVIQSSGGLANSNTVTVGSITGGAEIASSGKFTSNTTVGTIVQSSGGLANSNVVHIGSVSD